MNMKVTDMKINLSLCLLLAGAPIVGAGPGPQKQIPTDAVWFLHADIERFKQTQAGQQFMSELEKPEALVKLGALENALNFDLRKDLKGITIYSRSAEPADIVALAQGAFDADRLQTLVTAAREHQGNLHRDYMVHSWIDQRRADKEGGSPRSYGAIHTNGVVIIGQKSERVTQALDVLDKLEPDAATEKIFAGLGDLPATAFLTAAVRQPELPNLDKLPPPLAVVIKQLKGLRLTVGEVDDRLTFEVQIQADTEESARHFQSIIQGLKGMLALQKDNPAAVKLAQNITISQSGTAAIVTLKLAVNEVVQLVKDAAAKRARRR
jgi:hypothetical protein